MNVAFAFFVVGYSQNQRRILLGTNNKSVADLLCEQFDKLSDNDDFEVLTADELRFETIIGEERKETDDFLSAMNENAPAVDDVEMSFTHGKGYRA